MNPETILSAVVWKHLVFSLAHTFWQAGAAMLLLFVALRAIRARHASLRYALCAGGLAAVVLAWLVTFAILTRPAHQTVAIPGTMLPFSPLRASVGMEAWSGDHRTARTCFRQKQRLAEAWHPRRPLRRASSQESASATSAALEFLQSRWPTIAAAIWVIGAILMLLRATLSIGGVRRLASEARQADKAIVELVERLRPLLGVGRRVGVLINSRIASPAVMGILWPVILLPATATTGLSPEHLKAVLAHELAHVRRHDYLVNLLQMLAESLLFFNPCVWRLSRQIRIERESCCDQLASKAVNNPLALAEAIRDFAGYNSGCHASVRGSMSSPFDGCPDMLPRTEAWHPPTVALADSNTPLLDRIRRLLAPSRRPALRLPWLGLAVTLLAGLGAMVAAEEGIKTVVALLTPAQQVQKMAEIAADAKKSRPGNLILATKDNMMTLSGKIRTADGSWLPSINASVSSSYYESADDINSDSCSEPLNIGWFGGTFHATVPRGNIVIEVLTNKPDKYAPVYYQIAPKTSGDVKDIDIVIDQGLTASIKITDPKGNGLAGAELRNCWSMILDNRGGRGAREYDGLKTDVQGVVTLKRLPKGCSFRADVSCDGYQAETKDFTFIHKSTVVCVLTPAKENTGTVVDESGKPVAGAKIYLCDQMGPLTTLQSVVPFPLPMLASTDANGAFTIQVFKAGSIHSLCAVSPGHSSAFLVVRDGQKDMKFSLGKEVVLRGEVTGDVARAMNDGEVRISLVEYYPGPVYKHPDGCCPKVRKEKGKYVFETTGLYPGKVDVYFGNGAGGDHPVKTFRVVAGMNKCVVDIPTVQAVQAQEKPKRKVTLKFTVPEGMPLPSGDVGVMDAAQRGIFSLPHGTKATDGLLSFDAPIGVRLHLHAIGFVGYLYDEREFDVPPGKEPLIVEVACRRGGMIHGTLQYADGSKPDWDAAGRAMLNPFPAMYVKACLAADDKKANKGLRDGFAQCPHDGKYVTNTLSFGCKYRVVAQLGNYVCVHKDLVVLDEKNPIREINFQAGQGKTVTGKLLNADGTLAAEIELWLSTVCDEETYSSVSVKTDKAGQFAWKGVGCDVPVRYQIVVRVPWQPPPAPTTQATPPGPDDVIEGYAPKLEAHDVSIDKLPLTIQLGKDVAKRVP